MTQLLGLESEPYSGNWSLVKVLDGFALERKIRASGSGNGSEDWV